MFYIYIFECADKTYYTGYTNDLGARLKRHNEGLASKYTRSRRPVKIAWSKRCKNKSAAMSIEAKIKQLTREEKAKLVYRGC